MHCILLRSAGNLQAQFSCMSFAASFMWWLSVATTRLFLLEGELSFNVFGGVDQVFKSL